MIEKNEFGGWDVSCNTCGETETFGAHGTWQSMVQEMRDAGWRSRKRGKEWEHECPDCGEEPSPGEDFV